MSVGKPVLHLARHVISVGTEMWRRALFYPKPFIPSRLYDMNVFLYVGGVSRILETVGILAMYTVHKGISS